MNIQASFDAHKLAPLNADHTQQHYDKALRTLNFEQVCSLRVQESLGWGLAFIRRPMFQQPLAVIVKDDCYRVITAEGDLKPLHSIRGDYLF
jgi:hypothetical protein